MKSPMDAGVVVAEEEAVVDVEEEDLVAVVAEVTIIIADGDITVEEGIIAVITDHHADFTDLSVVIMVMDNMASIMDLLLQHPRTWLHF